MTIRLVGSHFGVLVEIAIVVDVFLVVMGWLVSIATRPRALVHPIWRNGTRLAALGMALLGMFVLLVDLAAKVENVHDLHAVVSFDDTVDAFGRCC